MNGDLLRGRRIEIEPGAGVGRFHRVPPHAVDETPHVAAPRTVDREGRARVGAVAAADVGRPRRSRRQSRVIAPARRHRLQELLRDDLLLDDVLRVDDRRLAGHGDCLFEGADREVDVDRGGEAGRELNAFPLERPEPGERERHDVGAGTQIDDLVLTFGVGGDRPDAFDQCGARCLDRHARQHAAR